MLLQIMSMNQIRQSTTNLKSKFLILFVLAIFLQGTACSKTILVCDQGCDFAGITEGINSADPGDTIEVQSGTYYENVNVSKPLILLGKDTGSGKPVIDAGGNGSAITLSTDGATLDGFNLTNSLGSWLEIWAGIEVNSNDSTIINNMAFNNENGILIAGSNNTILGNDAMNNIYGIKTKGSTKNSITDNNLSNNNYGLFILASRNNIIQNNQATNNEYGILLNESTGNNLSNNQMTENSYNFGCRGNNNADTTNLADGKPIYYLVRSANQEINSSSDAATVSCLDCYNLTIKGLNLNNNLYGIYLENTSNSLLEDNNLSSNRNGIAFVNSHHNTVKDNQATGNIEGIVFTSSRYNTVQGNKALNNQDGLYMNRSDYNRLLDNQASQSDNAIWLFRSGFNLLSGNNMTFNSLGARLNFAWLNTIFDNNISNNIQGILLDSSANNNFSANRITNNTKGILFDPLDNNTLSSDNQYFNNGADLEKIRSRSTAASGIPPTVSVHIISSPKGAAILKDGELQGMTPGPVYFTEPGEYIIEIKKEGYKDEELPIEIPEKISSETFPREMREQSVKLTSEGKSAGDSKK